MMSLVITLREGREIRKRMAVVKRIRFLVDKVIPLSQHLFDEAMKTIAGKDQEKVGTLLGCSLSLLFLLLGSIENASSRLQTDDQIRGAEVVDCLDLFSAVDKAVRSLLDISSRFPLLSVLVCPIAAANVSLASTLQSYNKAYNRLQSLVAC